MNDKTNDPTGYARALRADREAAQAAEENKVKEMMKPTVFPKMVSILASEHAALLAVAEAAEAFKGVGQYWFNYPVGVPFNKWSVDDRTRFVAGEKGLNKALANLAAVRAGKAVAK